MKSRAPVVDADDIADVVVASLIEDRHVGKIYELSGPHAVSFAEVAVKLSKATGRNIGYSALTLDEFRDC